MFHILLTSPQLYTTAKHHAVMYNAEKHPYYSRKIGVSMNRKLIAKMWYLISLVDSPAVHKLTDLLTDALSVKSKRIE